MLITESLIIWPAYVYVLIKMLLLESLKKTKQAKDNIKENKGSKEINQIITIKHWEESII